MITTEIEKPLDGKMLWMAAIILALANFIAVLDMTIANVSVPNIAGGLAATMSQGTWVITSYAVAEAITVPLTGWLAARFGAVKVFVVAMVLFGVFSALCGLASSLEFLVIARILQGLAGGPMMPLSQTLMLKIFPKEKAGAAMGIWAVTTLVAPVVGPILGGWICDNYHWSWIFFINVPVTIVCAYISWKLLKRYETTLEKSPIDKIGLVLLVVWVGALQLMLDEGKDLDWFSSWKINALAIITIIGFIAFMIWELNEKHPIVALNVFRHRGYSASVLTISLGFAAFFGANVLTPLWLQTYMGYTATSAGKVMAWSGVAAVFMAPVVAIMVNKIELRKLIFWGLIWIGIVTLTRSWSTTDMTYWDIALPILGMGLGLPFFFMPLTNLALASVDDSETASAAGLMSFLRTLAGAFSTSFVNTSWENKTIINHVELVAITDQDGSTLKALIKSGMTPDMAYSAIDRMITSQSVMLATNEIMLWVSIAFIVAATAIWIAPKPNKIIDTSMGGH